MNRKDFLQKLALVPLIGVAMKVNEFFKHSQELSNTNKIPALFVGHGHPMNAIQDNHFTQSLEKLGSQIEKVNAILVISAHWETRGTYVSTNTAPKTIYDFGHFHDDLFKIQYNAPGAPDYAKLLHDTVKTTTVQTDDTMGLDHGAWTILKFLFPKANIPVFQMSIDYTQPPAFHYALAKELQALRHKGVLVIGSGNIVHNLRQLDWYHQDAKPFDWAVEFDATAKTLLDKGDHQSLVNYQNLGTAAQLSIPTNDHYLPMLYTLGLQDQNDAITYTFEGFQYGGISMRCFQIA